MHSRFLYSIHLLFTAAFLVAPIAVAQQQMNDVVVRVDRDVTNVVVRSSDSRTLSLLQSAFKMHGGYRVVGSMSEASFAFSVDPVNSTGARLSIYSGVPEQLQFTETMAGTSGRNAIFKAIDRAIQKTSGRPGFFAGKLTFVSEVSGSPEVFVSDFLFGEVLKLTNDFAEVVRPRWSPDGRFIVFTSYRKGYPDIYRLDRQSNVLEPIVSLKGTNVSARYNPDGSRMAMVLTGKGNNAEVYMGDSNANQLQRFTMTKGDESAPCWSPNGDRICVASGQTGRVQLYVASSFSSPAALKRIPTNVSGYCAEPDWNPYDPNFISFTAAEGQGHQIAIHDFSKGASVKVTTEQGMAQLSQWLSDGRHLIYTLKTGSSKRILLFDTVTRARTVLSPSSLGDVSEASFLAPPR